MNKNLIELPVEVAEVVDELIDMPYMKDGSPVWVDFPEGMFSTDKSKVCDKAEYVNKQLVSELFNKYLYDKASDKMSILNAINYFLNN